MIEKLILHCEGLKIEDSQVFERVVLHLNIQVSHLLKDSFIQLVGTSSVAVSYTFTAASSISERL